MNNMSLYKDVSFETSKNITERYSTSFSSGTKMLGEEIRPDIYAIYGFVRVADEIVDTFHDFNKEQLLDEFIEQTFKAINDGISTNPVLNSFQFTVNRYGIDHDLIRAFFDSMRSDLKKSAYDQESISEYIYGSAEVVGLMCLRIFVNGDDKKYKELRPSAKSLGAAFQKVNFLRDIRHDFEELGRSYFPEINWENFSQDDLELIYRDIEKDFENALIGIKQLPNNSRFGVYVTYKYYFKLFKKLKKHKQKIFNKRIRINNLQKTVLALSAWVKFKISSDTKWKQTFFMCFFVFFLFNVNAQNLEESRQLLIDSQNHSEGLLENAEKLYHQDDPVIKGYSAMFYFLYARSLINPFDKLKYFNKGKALLDSLIKINPNEPELRLLRYSVQKDLPYFLFYDNKEEDHRMLKELYRSKQIHDSYLNKAIEKSISDDGK